MPGKSGTKAVYFEKLKGLLDEYKSIFLVGVDNVSSQQMHEIRQSLRGDAVVLMGKNTMVRRAIKGFIADSPEYERLLPHIKGNVGFIFTNGDLKTVRDKILDNKVAAPARAGALAPLDVYVPAGNTGMEPGKTSFFQALGVPTKIARGTIEITSELKLVEKGARVGASEATLLNMLNISPFTYGMKVQQVYEDGQTFSPDVLDVGEDQLLKAFSSAVATITAISLAANYPTLPSIIHSLIGGYKKLLAVAVETDYSWEGIEELKDRFCKFGNSAQELLGLKATLGVDKRYQNRVIEGFPTPATGLKRLIMGTLTFEGVIEKTLTEFMLSTENEHNWHNRQTLLKQLAQVFQEAPTIPRWVWDKMKPVMGRIIATAASERTQLSKQACETIGALFKAAGSDMQPYLETTLPTILQLCGSAKKQNQVNGNNAMKTIIQFSGYHKGLLHHICTTFSDKRKDARALAPAWLSQYINVYKDALDPTKDLPVIEKAITLGLEDSDVRTREGTRETYWRYEMMNEAAADAIMCTLNLHAANALKADKHNPNKSLAPAKVKAKRDFSDTSVFTKEYPFRPAEGLNEYLKDPNPKPEYVLNEHAQRKLRDEHKALVKASIRDESTPIYELQGQEELKKKLSRHRLDAAHESKSVDARHPADTGANVKPFLSAPVRRPRVVATPITHDNKPASRSMTKAEATRKADAMKKAEQKARPQAHNSGRHTPTINEERPTDGHVRPATKAHKPLNKTKTVAAGSDFSPSSWDLSPTLSKRDPNGTTTPMNVSLDANNYVLPPFPSPKEAGPVFSPSSLEVTSENSAPAEAHLDLKRMIEAADPSKPTTGRPPFPSPKKAGPSSLEGTSKNSAPAEAHLDIKRMIEAADPSKPNTGLPPSECSIVPISGQENTVQSPGKSKVAAAPDEGLVNARQTIPKVADAVKEGRLDALGYRKLRKLLLTYPGQLFTGVRTDETYTDLYVALINHFSKNESVIEGKQPSQKHSMYTSMAIIDMVQLLITQYPYGEPQPGMTLLALMRVKANGQTLAAQVDDKIRSAMMLFVDQILDRFDPLPVMDAIGEAIEAKTPNLLDTGVFVLTRLVVGARERGYVLDEDHQQRLADLLRICLQRMRPSFKRHTMQFATVLFDTIKPEARFRALFGQEGDLNLIYYCIGKSF
ncbi:hypothetical protein DV738_g3102, partial [Chaetothyriales sp. CBS 135597]